MRRREFIALISGAAAWPWPARAQQPQHARVGWFTVAPHPYIDGFRRGMRELGWVEGENLVIEYRYADGHPERLPDLVAALARGASDVIVISGSDAVAAARASIRSIPLVGIASDMGTGTSLARSEGNLTGISLLFDEVARKWPELLVEAMPRAQRLGMIFDASPSDAMQFEAASATAAKLGKTLLALRIENVDLIGGVLERARSEKLDGLIFAASPVFTANAARIVELVMAAGLPAMHEGRVLVERGALMSYGPNLNEIFQHAASYVDRILKGAKPAELPIERPTRYELVINMKAAKALAIELPSALLARADEVIE